MKAFFEFLGMVIAIESGLFLIFVIIPELLKLSL
jgi:hypothetical protein